MDKFVIRGQRPLSGTVSASGSKNAALPVLAASLLVEGTVVLEGIPRLSDISVMCEILSALGCHITRTDTGRISINTEGLRHYTVPDDLAGRLRGSFLVMGPLLARCGQVSISMPGGCPIGARPIDLHIKGLAALGVRIKNTGGSIEAAAGRLTGAKIYLDFPSVGATENIMSAAVLAEGTTTIENAAVEPEIVDLAKFLCSMGARISGAGTDTVKITGVNALHETRYTIIPDRIEAGTYMIAAAM
ncbi:MAG: UDP-N-acetylglucosamine 1-carboxyvinyltransferase, partial [Clostridia bacterium]